MEDTSEQNRKLAGEIFETLWNRGDLTAASRLFATDYKGHDPSDSMFGSSNGIDGVRHFVETFRTASSDLHFDVVEIVAQNDVAMVMWNGRGTHTGEFFGMAPTGNKVQTSGVVVYRIAQGKAVEGWHCWNSNDIFEQLGGLPPNLAAVISKS